MAAMDLLSTVTVLAHAGHWFLSLVYIAPVLAVLGYIGRQNRQDRKRGDVVRASPTPPEPRGTVPPGTDAS